MQIQQLHLVNYRGIEDIMLDFGGNSTVLYGRNGCGKSSILKAIGLIFSQIITKVVNNQFKQQIEITKEDVRYGTSLASLKALMEFDDGSKAQYGFSYRRDPAGKLINRKELTEFAEQFTSLYLNDDVMIPAFVHYGVNRSVLDIPVRIRSKHEFGRLETYQNAIGVTTDFRTFFEWFRNQEDLENEQKITLHDLQYKDVALEAVRKAIQSMLPELSEIRIRRNPLRMCATKDGESLDMRQFSDGEKCLLAMLGDLARRLALANPHAENPLLGGGIVLIDEVELHMHPSWQRMIVPVLHETFPNVQFILTTHSPLVLSDLTSDFRIFALDRYDKTLSVSEMTPGCYDVNMILEDRMSTPSVSPVVQKLEHDIFQMIQNGDYGSAAELTSRLSKMTNGTHPAIAKATILLRRMGSTQKGGV